MSKLRWGLGVIVILVIAGSAVAAEEALWLRYPAISPDGETVVFSFRGDLWTVPAGGGQAAPLTVHAAHDYMPVWSSDGRTIAFASDRYGNFDVFVMPAAGGEAKRLTFHSSHDYPSSFTSDDTAVLFASGRLDAPTCVQYPRGRGGQPELYRVALSGGMPEQVLTTPAIYAVFDRAGARLAYSDLKGLEDEWRKHDDSSFARDLWMYDVAAGQHSRLTEFGADDRQPVWGPGDRSLFFLSERSSTFNVWRLDLDDPDRPVQLTRHDTHPVRFLSASHAGDLCYTFDGAIWVWPAGASAGRRIEVAVATDRRHSLAQWIDVAKEITEFDVSPDDDEIVFIARGEVFVTSADHATTRRITNTSEQERSVSFSPDGRSLLYASERGGSWNLYLTDLTDDDEPDFFNATALVERAVLATEAETFQPRFSPDGKEVAYLEERTTLKVLNLDTGVTRTILPAGRNYSYTDGDQWYEWSPDGQWFLVEFLSPTRWSTEVGLVPVSGEGEVVNLTRSGYEDMDPRWVMDGEAMLWFTDRHGMRRHGGFGSHDDVFAAFFTDTAWDRFHLTEAELEQVKAREKKEEKKKSKKDGDEDEEADEDDEAPKLADPIDIVLDGLEDRTVRLTIHSAALADAKLTPDGEKLLYLARFEKGYDLWSYAHRKKEIKLLAKLNARSADGLEIDAEGKKAFLLADRKLMSVDLDKGKAKPVKLKAEMELDPAAERAYLFEHVWRQAGKKFYNVDLHGVDWLALKQAHARFLPYVDNNWDLAELLSEMLGELNASHTGSGHRPRRERVDATAALGFFPDTSWTGDGVKIAEVVDKSPLHKAGSKIAPGVVIVAVDGDAIAAGSNWYPLLNRKADTLVRLTLRDPDSDEEWQETVKPITLGEESELLYRRWVRTRREEVSRLSDGRIGYAHIRSMSDRSYREIFEEIFGRELDKEAIVLDTRFNTGGNLVESLTAFLTGEVYALDVARGQKIGIEPMERWTRPSIVVMNEGNYSDAHCFPVAYTDLGIGETVGMPVPGTCTAVWWETLQDRSLYFGIPQVGIVDNDGDYLENKHLAPDHLVDNDPALEAAGRDQQLEKAVEVLLAELDG